MEAFTVGKLLYLFVGGIVTGFVAWIWKRFNKIEDNADKASTAITKEQARILIKELVSEALIPVIQKQEADNQAMHAKFENVKTDVRDVGQALMDGLKDQGNRMDTIFMHMIDRGSKK